MFFKKFPAILLFLLRHSFRKLEKAKDVLGRWGWLLFSITVFAANGGIVSAEVVLTATSMSNMPGEEVNVALFLKMEGEKIDELKIELAVPLGLEYMRAGLGISAELGGVKMEVQPASSMRTQVIQLKAGEASIPNGLVVSLDFIIEPDAPTGAIVRLEPKASAKFRGQEVATRSEAGQIEIIGTPPLIAACFFYMH